MLSIYSSEDGKFHQEISSKFQADEVGLICRKDATIQLIGKRLYQKGFRKVDKTMKVRKSVMNDMRLLDRLFTYFKESCEDAMDTKEMFQRKNFNSLEHGIEIEKMSCTDGKLKHGLKMTMFYLLKTSAKIIIRSHLAAGEDLLASEVEKFVLLLDLNPSVIFGDAVINQSRQECLRMPEMQADEEEIFCLRKYTMEAISSDYNFSINKEEYIKLRDSIYTRVTLFNGRRGGEPSRFKVSNFNDAINGRWVSKKDLDKDPTSEKKLLKDMLIAYQTGKGNHLVPVLIPRDCLKGMEILADQAMRDLVGVTSTNPYLFANTEASSDHVMGWKSIHKMCVEAGVINPELLTACKHRHLISTKYCELERNSGNIFTSTWDTPERSIMALTSIPFRIGSNHGGTTFTGI